MVGTITRKGDDLIRVKSKRAYTSKTEKQLNQRSKFSLVTKFMKPLNRLLKIGLKLVVGDLMSPYNYGSRNALKKAITGTYPDYKLDYSKVIISEGELGQVKKTGFELAADNVTFSWEDDSVGTSHPTDKTVLLIYNENNHQLNYSVGVTTRVTKGGVLPLPNGEIGDNVLFFLFFQSSTEPDIVSTSQFVGSVIVTE